MATVQQLLNALDGQFKSRLLRMENDAENLAIVEGKRRKKELEKYNRQVDKTKRTTQLQEALSEEEEEALKRARRAKAVQDYQRWQMRQKELQKQDERQQARRQAEAYLDIDKQYVQELNRQAQINADSKKKLWQEQQEVLSMRRLKKERQRQIERAEEERARREQLELEEEYLQRNAKLNEKFRKQQIAAQPVWESMAELKKKEAAALALRDKKKRLEDEALREAELAKVEKEKKEKAAYLQSMSAYNKDMIEKRRKEKAERQKVPELPTEQEADGLLQLLENEELRAQKTREGRRSMDTFNVSMAAEKRANLERQKREERDAQARALEQAAVWEKEVQQLAAHELQKASEKVKSQRKKVQFMPELTPKPTYLPPLSKASTKPLSAKDVARDLSSSQARLPPIQPVKQRSRYM